MRYEYKLLNDGQGVILTRQPGAVDGDLIVSFDGAPDGAVALFVTTVKLVNAAFEKFHGYAYFTAFGFLISTIVSVFPGVNSIGDILLLVIGLLFIFAFNKFANKKMA